MKSASASHPATPPSPRYASETSKHRAVVAPYCVGYGIDIGFGGDPVTPTAIRLDLPSPYANTGDLGVQIGGDCRSLHWFADDVLDYVYSSHVLEDFAEAETRAILREWVRVVRVGGRVVLLLPDQQRYLRYCVATGQVESGIVGNLHHSIDHFSLRFVQSVAATLAGVRIGASCEKLVAPNDPRDDYSFFVVLEKTASTSSGTVERAELREQLQSAWAERDALQVEVRKLAGQLKQRFLDRVLSFGARLQRRLGGRR